MKLPTAVVLALLASGCAELEAEPFLAEQGAGVMLFLMLACLVYAVFQQKKKPK